MPITAGKWLLFVGDSITATGANEGGFAWFDGPGGLLDQLEGIWGAPPTAAKTTGTVAAGTIAPIVTGEVGIVTATVPGYKTVAVSSLGQSGANSTALATLVGTAIQLVPTYTVPIVILEGGINDAAEIQGGSRTIAQYIAGKDSQYAQILARWPTAMIIDLSCLCKGEEWAAGPVWNNTVFPFDTQIEDVDDETQIKVAATAGAVYVNNRDALLVWEAVNNPGMASEGFAVIIDGTAVHPTFAGMILMGQTFITDVGVTP